MFSFECRKTETKVIMLINHNTFNTDTYKNTHTTPAEVKASTCITGVKRGKTNTSKSRFQFTSDWLRKCRKLFQPVTERSKAKVKQTRTIFNTQYMENCSIFLTERLNGLTVSRQTAKNLTVNGPKRENFTVNRKKSSRY